MRLDSTPALATALAHGTSPAGAVIAIPQGTRLVFGRGPGADLAVPAGRGLSPRAGAGALCGGRNGKVFLGGLLWCRPWLVDEARSSPLPRTPEIARAALQVTDAHHEIECFDTDPACRDRLSARVGEHLKVLRRKLHDRGLVRSDVRLSDEVAVGAVIEHGVIAQRDLDRLGHPARGSRPDNPWPA